MKGYRLALLLSLFSIVVLGQKTIDWQSDQDMGLAHASYLFQKVDDNQIVAEYQSEKLLNPASTIKLITSLIYLEKKGDKSQFSTSVYYQGKIEKDGTLKGNIIIQGSGDPSFGSERYGNKNSLSKRTSEIVKAIQYAGITCIDGDIIVDESYYGSDCTPHTWTYNDLGNYYASGIWGLNVNENAYSLSFRRGSKKGGKLDLDQISPPIPGLYFKNELTLNAPNSGDQSYIFCAPYQYQAHIRGTLPAGKGKFSIRGAIPDAPLFFVQHLQTSLEINNIKSNRAKVSYDAISKDKQIWTHKGVPAKMQVKSAIEKSINLYCEAFLKELGNGDREKGTRVIEEYLLREKLIDNSRAFQQRDGSGLSQRNFISTRTMVGFLAHQLDRMGSDKLYPLLARNGYDGTLASAFLSKNLKGKIYGKSGSMGGVRAYAGFLKARSGDTIAFSVMVNNYTVSSRTIIAKIEKLLEEVWANN